MVFKINFLGCISLRCVLVPCFLFLFVNCVVGANERNSDNYITSSKSECFSSKNVISCVKYKVARFIWSVATGKIQLIKNPIGNGNFNIVAMQNDEADTEFSEYRLESDNSEVSRAFSFLKRSIHMFLTNHGIQITFGKDSGARILNDSDVDALSENRGKKKRKLQLILPLVILMKMMNLKMMLMNVLFGIGLVQLLLVGGGFFLFNYFKNNTHCKIQGLPVHTHSHIVESPQEPEPYSSYSGYHYSHPSYHSPTYSKDWASNRAYSAYSNYMDSTQRSNLS